MLAGIVPFALVAILVIGHLMDKAGFKFKSEGEEARAAMRERVQATHDRCYRESIEAEARAIVSREKREIELRAALERVRAGEQQ